MIVVAAVPAESLTPVPDGGEPGLRRLQHTNLGIGVVERSVCLIEFLPVNRGLVLSRGLSGAC